MSKRDDAFEQFLKDYPIMRTGFPIDDVRVSFNSANRNMDMPGYDPLEYNTPDIAKCFISQSAVGAVRAEARAAPGVNPKDIVGATKTPLGLVPWGAMAQVSAVFAVGAEKYGPFNWRQCPVQRMTYLEAALRHIFADIDGQTVDPETGLPHIAHAIAGLLILSDAASLGSHKDNRPTPGNAAELLKLAAGQAAEAIQKTRDLKAGAAQPNAKTAHEAIRKLAAKVDKHPLDESPI